MAALGRGQQGDEKADGGWVTGGGGQEIRPINKGNSERNGENLKVGIKQNYAVR